MNVTVSNRPLTLTMKLVAVTCLEEQGGMAYNGFHSKAPSSRPAIPPAAVGPGTATSATTKYKHVIFTVPIFKIQNYHQ